MIEIEKKGLLFLQFPNLFKFTDIKHGIFTRKGGVSKSPFDSLNLSFNTGDKKRAVEHNRRIVLSCIEEKRQVFLNQSHSVEVVVLDKKTLNRVEKKEMGFHFDGDAVITNVLNLPLFINMADCQCILLYDPGKKVVANIHSGWRGSVRDIIGITIDRMVDLFGCNPCSINAGVSPSLGQCCAEFVNYEREIPIDFWKYKDGANRFDFWSLSYDQLTGAGLLDANIYISRICTKCNSKVFYSYRKEQRTGRAAGFIGLC